MQAFSRLATSEELKKASNFFDMLKTMKGKADAADNQEMALWKEYCHSIFNLKEFIYLI
jgi:1,2-phenylacetyl-CoA epoxidase catalytic subunit